MEGNILVVDDEKEIADLVEVYLKNENYTVYKFYTGEEALACIRQVPLDLAILDVMLPDVDGFSICQKIREKYYFPVIMLTARVEDMDKIMGLTLGADDYITKPFEIIELLARVENVLRRFHKVEQDIRIGDLEINVVARTVNKGGRNINLTIKEFDLLLLFMRNPDRALYREMIYEQVWDSPYMGDSRTVDLHVQRLRRKAGLEQQIESVYKVGYRFRSNVS